jgi:hypothetical protein
MKSITKCLLDAAELAAVTRISHQGTVCVDVSGAGRINFHLSPQELARVAKLLNVPRRKIGIRDSLKGSIHINFTARGADWCACILAENAEAFYREIEMERRLAQHPRVIEHAPKLLTSNLW